VDAPESLRAIYGQDGVKNSLHGSENGNFWLFSKLNKYFKTLLKASSAKRELDFFFAKSAQFKVKKQSNTFKIEMVKWIP